ncbi:MAG: hypothetical protein JWM27_527 [Gemmatimonadetes bacterium]|nr:hypothetical protein [Gemmatimonadota bacterium]
MKPTSDTSPSRAKRPYDAPRLLVYGDMRLLTQTSGGTVGGMDMIDMAFKTGF